MNSWDEGREQGLEVCFSWGGRGCGHFLGILSSFPRTVYSKMLGSFVLGLLFYGKLKVVQKAC